MDTLTTFTPAAFDTAAVVEAVTRVTGLPNTAAYMVALILMALLATLTRQWRAFAGKPDPRTGYKGGLFPQWGPRLGAFALAGVFAAWILGIRDPVELIEYTGLMGAGIIGTWEAALKPIRGIWNSYVKPLLRRWLGGAAAVLLVLALGAAGGGVPDALAQTDEPDTNPALAAGADPPERWSLKRLRSGLGLNYVIYEDGLPDGQAFSGLQVKWPLVYSLSRYLAVGGVGRFDFHHQRYMATAGGTIATPGSTEPGASYSVAIGAGYTWLLGEGYDELEAAKAAAGQPWQDSRLETWVNLSWIVLKDSRGYGLGAVQLVPSYIPDNKQWQFAAGIFLAPF